MRLQRAGPFWLPAIWLRHDYLISRFVAQFFLFSAVWGIISFPFFIGYLDPARMPSWIGIPVKVLVLAGVAPVLLLWLGTWRYWVRLDDSGLWAKRIWFVVLLFGFWCGAVIYYFSVYFPRWRQADKKRRGAENV